MKVAEVNAVFLFILSFPELSLIVHKKRRPEGDQSNCRSFSSAVGESSRMAASKLESGAA